VKIKTNKILALATLFLILAMLSSMMAYVPTASAGTTPTWAFLAAAPNPIGVNQQATITFWLNEFPPTASGAQGDRWEGFSLEITKPNGDVQTMGPYESDPVGSKYIQYTPDQVGNYSLKFSFPGQNITGLRYGQPINNYYEPSESRTVILQVQEDPIPTWQDAPLPTDYWDRPIYSENRDWYQIGGNWLLKGYDTSKVYSAQGFNPYTTAPNTGHILWTKPIAFGGLVGGNYTTGTVEYYTGLSYEGKWNPPIIMQGRLYYNLPVANSPSGGQFACVDIRTGETLWTKTGTLTLGQVYDYESPNQHGAHAYLWSCPSSFFGPPQNWTMYDAFTGEQLLTFYNTQNPTFTMSGNGDLIGYVLNGMGNWLCKWNSSKAIPTVGTSGPNAWSWSPPKGASLDWSAGIEWNVTVPDVPGSQSINRVSGDRIWASSFLMSETPPITVDVAYDVSDEGQGKQLWVANRTDMIDPGQFAGGIGPLGEGVYAVYSKEKLVWYGYNINTGTRVWGPTEPYDNDWGMYVAVLGGEPQIAYGKMYAQAFDGCIHAFDITDGTEVWTYYAGSAGFETPYGTYPFYGGPTIADGKVYSTNGEHSPGSPLWRGERLHCVDAETGEGVWNITGWFQGPVVADGYLMTLNGADNQIYCFGKGQTATTVTASPKVSVNGDSVLIEGSVMDQSPGATDIPAIADEDMTAWMEHVYMQKPMPSDAKGVEVSLDTFDPNGNFVHIGNTTSDASGMFKLMFTPEVPGEYTIMASFGGSDSYWRSSAETAIGVGEAPQATQTPAPLQASMTDTYVMAFGSVAIIAIIIGFAVLILLQRKR
jgi:outer membrane protein assembly factor BamB